jgi:preprotein translocase subunit SecD
LIAGVRVAGVLLALLTVLIGAYLVAVFVGGRQDSVSSIDRSGGSRVTFTPQPLPDGSAPTPATLAQSRKTIASRVSGLGVTGAEVVVQGGSVVVTVPGDRADEIRGIGATGLLHLRPVINSIPAQEDRQPSGQPTTGSTAERIAREKALRQSTNPSVQVLDLQFQATRCGRPDALTDNDDPALPLVTCSADRKSVYLLGPSILGNDQIDSASSRLGQMGYVVELKFKADAVKTWADYTAAHIGAQVALVLDTAVVSAPAIRESIPNGRVEISGGEPPFTDAQARHLATELNDKPLPLAFTGSDPERVPPKPVASERNWLSPPVAVIVGAITVLAILISVQLFWIYRWILARPDGGDPRRPATPR